MQNRSFDNLFGQFPRVNGLPKDVSQFSQMDSSGNVVTPHLLDPGFAADMPHGRQEYLRVWNGGAMDKYAFFDGADSLGYYDQSTPGIDLLWQWASDFAIADKFFPSVMNSAPSNQLFMVAASDNNFPFGIRPFYGPCNPPDTTPQPYTFPNVGDQLTRRAVTWSWFQEDLGKCDQDYQSQQNPFQFFTTTHNLANIKDLSAFFDQLSAGTLPSVSFIQASDQHSTHPSSGPVTDGLVWLDGLLRQIQASSIWPGVVVIITWDESGGFWDHVSPPQVDSEGYGARVPMLVVSPFAKKHYVSHVQMDNVSILKFIQSIWGLPPLNGREALSSDIRDMLTF
jgi:phospholipase C